MSPHAPKYPSSPTSSPPPSSSSPSFASQSSPPPILPPWFQRESHHHANKEQRDRRRLNHPHCRPQLPRISHLPTFLCSPSRLRILVLGIVCVVLGWGVTATLGPSSTGTFPGTSSSAVDFDGGLRRADGGGGARGREGGWLNEGSEFEGTLLTATTTAHVAQGGGRGRDGVIGGVLPEEMMEEEEGEGDRNKPPSVTGALAALHDAVRGKFRSWNPYHARLEEGKGSAGGQKMTAAAAKTKSTGGKNSTSSMLGGPGIPPGEHVLDGLSEDEQLGARTRIGKCTILFHGNSYWERAIRTHERHDREHGYRLHILRQQLLDDVWSKPAYMLSLLLRELAKPEGERLEWLFWVDADTVLLNPHIPIDIFLPPPGSEFDDIHLVYSNDWNGLNNGVFPVRVNTWAVQLFSAIVSFRHYRPQASLVFRDQSAMDILMHEPEFAAHVVQAPQRWFNAYQGEQNETLAPFQTRRGDFLVHFAGVGNREERMGYWLERAEQRLDDWEIPLKSTSYPQEARDFWAEQSNLRRQKKEDLAGKRLWAKELLVKVEGQLRDYGDRLGEEQRSAVERQKNDLKSLLEDEAHSNDVGMIEEAGRKLEELAQPLSSAIAAAHKVLLKSAHEAIFAGEKELLEGGDDGADAELRKISERVQRLKDLVMTPQENWNRHEIAGATNAVAEAIGQLHDKHAASQAEKMKAEEEQKQKQKQQQAQALEEERKQAEAKAKVDVPGDTLPH